MGDTPLDAVHVMRTCLAPFAGPDLDRRTATGRPACGLDLDDDESRTRHRLAGLYAVRGDGVASRYAIARVAPTIGTCDRGLVS